MQAQFLLVWYSVQCCVIPAELLFLAVGIIYSKHDDELMMTMIK